jgi:hypothetical protein
MAKKNNQNKKSHYRRMILFSMQLLIQQTSASDRSSLQSPRVLGAHATDTIADTNHQLLQTKGQSRLISRNPYKKCAFSSLFEKTVVR